jgi:hypothetical protein
MEQGAICLFNLYVNLWKCEGDIRCKRLGPLFKLNLSKLSVRGWVLFVSMGVLVDAVPFLGSLVNFVSLEFGVIIDNCACISSHRGLCAS